jgi:hypothetical protein
MSDHANGMSESAQSYYITHVLCYAWTSTWSSVARPGISITCVSAGGSAHTPSLLLAKFTSSLPRNTAVGTCTLPGGAGVGL